jgi:hypothetical protein
MNDFLPVKNAHQQPCSYSYWFVQGPDPYIFHAQLILLPEDGDNAGSFKTNKLQHYMESPPRRQ